MIEPDEETKKRIRALADAGTLLVQVTNEEAGDDVYFQAKQSLKDFKAGIDRLNLDPESRSGMNNLISYLEKKFEKRQLQANNDTVGY